MEALRLRLTDTGCTPLVRETLMDDFGVDSRHITEPEEGILQVQADVAILLSIRGHFGSREDITVEDD